MSVAHIITAITVLFTGLLPSSCSKSSSAPKAAPAMDKVASAHEKNLGELTMTNHYEIEVQLGAGKSCRITPIVVDRKNVRLVMTLESKKANGQTEGLSVTQVVTREGKPFEVAVGDMNLTMTPKIGE